MITFSVDLLIPQSKSSDSRPAQTFKCLAIIRRKVRGMIARESWGASNLLFARAEYYLQRKKVSFSLALALGLASSPAPPALISLPSAQENQRDADGAEKPEREKASQSLAAVAKTKPNKHFLTLITSTLFK